MISTGFLSLLGVYGGSRSTERIGHPNEVKLVLLSESITETCFPLYTPEIPDGANLVGSKLVKERKNGGEVVIGKRTRRGDLSSDIHNNIEQFRNCRIRVDIVVSSKDSYGGIRSQVARGCVSGLVNSDIPRWHVILVTSFDRDIVSLSSLQNEAHELIDVTVHIFAPRHRVVQ